MLHVKLDSWYMLSMWGDTTKYCWSKYNPHVEAYFHVFMYLSLKGLQMYGLKWRALSDNVEFTVVIMTWVTVTGYLCHKRPLICSVCRSHNPALSPFMIYHQIYTMSATKGCRKCLHFWSECEVRVAQSRFLRIIGY